MCVSLLVAYGRLYSVVGDWLVIFSSYSLRTGSVILFFTITERISRALIG